MTGKKRKNQIKCRCGALLTASGTGKGQCPKCQRTITVVARDPKEAAATGLPLIGTDMPGVREAISHGVNGTLIPTHDSAALARAVIELADDPGLSERYGIASLERAKNKFDHWQVVGKYINMYEELWSRVNKA